MANNRVARDRARCKLKEIERQYYRAAAEYKLLVEGISNPSELEISNEAKYLFHIYFGLSILLEKPLTKREIEVLYRASCGESLEKTARILNTSESNIKKIRISSFIKLNAENLIQAGYVGTRLDYLPVKDKNLLVHPINIKEAENASA